MMKLGKKLISCLLSAAIVAGGVAVALPVAAEQTAITAQAAVSNVWSGKISTSWYKADKDQLYIRSAEDLAGLAHLVSNGNTMEGKHIILTKDLVMNDTSNYGNWYNKPPKNNWTPIGIKPGAKVASLTFNTPQTGFAGTFDGNGHTISGLYCKHDTIAGLFGTVEGGTVMRTILKKAYILAQEPSSYNEMAKVHPIAGGIAGKCKKAYILECEVGGKVMSIGQVGGATSTMSSASAGGIVGEYEYDVSSLVPAIFLASFGVFVNPVLYCDGSNNNGKDIEPGIYCCINRADIKAETYYYNRIPYINGNQQSSAGGIVGYGADYRQGGMNQCVSFGNIQAVNGVTGGLLGYTENGFRMQRSYYTNPGTPCGKVYPVLGNYAKDVVNKYPSECKKFAVTLDNQKIIARNLGKCYTVADNALHLSCDKNYSFTLNRPTLSLGVGESFKLIAYIRDLSDKTVEWRSSNYKVVWVDKKTGYLRTAGTGTAWVTAKAKDGSEKSCMISVKKAPNWVALSRGAMTLKVGQTATLSASVAKDCACATRNYRTSNPGVVKMTKTYWTAAFKAIKPGVAYVTVRTYNGLEKSCKVTVVK